MIRSLAPPRSVSMAPRAVVAPVAAMALAVITSLSAGVAMAGSVETQSSDAAQTSSTPAATAAATASPPVNYLDLRSIDVLRGATATAGKDKATSCAVCHGENGVSIAPMFPNLAGQPPEYLYWALVDFKRGTRPQSPMSALVASLSDQDMRDLAAYYTSLPPSYMTAAATQATADERELRARGEELYRHGKPAAGIPPCQGCHGVAGTGHPLAWETGGAARYRAYPMLRGQTAQYLETKLNEYRAGVLRDSTNDFIMQAVARHLDDETVRALAAWLAQP